MTSKLTDSKIQPRQEFSRCPPAHLDAIDGNNSHTLFKGCEIKITKPGTHPPTFCHILGLFNVPV